MFSIGLILLRFIFIIENNEIDNLDQLTKRNIYKPYISDLISSIKTLQRYGSKFQSQIKFRTGLFTHFKSIIKGIYQQLWKIDIYSNRSINYYKIIEK